MTIKTRNELLHILNDHYKNLCNLFYNQKKDKDHNVVLHSIIQLTNFEDDILSKYNNYYNNYFYIKNNYYRYVINKLNEKSLIKNKNYNDYIYIVYLIKQLEEFSGIDINLLIHYISKEFFDLQDIEKAKFYNENKYIFEKLSEYIGAIEVEEDESGKEYINFDIQEISNIFDYCLNYTKEMVNEVILGTEILGDD